MYKGKGAPSEASFAGTARTSLTSSTGSDEDVASFLERGTFVKHLRVTDRIKRWFKHQEKALFAAVYAMAQENAFRVKYSLVGQFVDFLQLLSFSFSADFGWGSDYDLIFSVLTGPFRTISWEFYQVFFWLVVALIALALFVASYVGVSFRKSDFHLVWPIQVLRTVVNLLVTVLFIPVAAVLLSVIKADSNGYLSRFSASQIVAWNGTTIVYGVISIVALALFVPFCMLMGLLNFEFGSRTKDIMARHSSRLDFMYLIVKAVLVFVTDLASEQVLLRLFLMVGLTVILVATILLFVPYYNESMNYARSALLGTLFGASVSTMIRVFSPSIAQIELTMALFLHLGIALVFGFFTGLLMYWRIRPHLKSGGSSVYRLVAAGRRGQSSTSSGNFMSGSGTGTGTGNPSDIRLANIRAARRPSQQSIARGDGQRSRGSINRMNTRTSAGGTKRSPPTNVVASPKSKVPAFLRSIYHYYIASQVQLRVIFLRIQSEKDSVEVAETLFQHMLTVYPDVVFLRILYTNFLLSYKNDWIAATTQVRRVKLMRPSFDMRWLMYVLHKQVEREMRSARVGTSKTMGLMTYVDFQHNFGLARKYHAAALKKIRAFWEIVLMEQGALGKIGEAHRLLVKDEKRATQAYSRVLNRFPESPLLWRMYGQYLQEVQNDHENGEGAFALAEDIEERQTKSHTTNFGGPGAQRSRNPDRFAGGLSSAQEEPEQMEVAPTPTPAGPPQSLPRFHRSNSAPESPPPPRFTRRPQQMSQPGAIAPMTQSQMQAQAQAQQAANLKRMGGRSSSAAVDATHSSGPLPDVVHVAGRGSRDDGAGVSEIAVDLSAENASSTHEQLEEFSGPQVEDIGLGEYPMTMGNADVGMGPSGASVPESMSGAVGVGVGVGRATGILTQGNMRRLGGSDEEKSDGGSQHGGSQLSRRTGATGVTGTSGHSSDRALKRRSTSDASDHVVINKIVFRFNVTFAILILLVAANYTAIRVLVSGRSDSVIEAVDLRVAALDSGIATFELALHQYVNNTRIYDEAQLNWRILPKGMQAHYTHVLNSLKQVENDWHKLFSDASSIDTLREYFANSYVDITTYETGSPVKSHIHLADAIVQFIATTRRAANNLATGHFTRAQLSADRDLRFVVRASMFEIPVITQGVLERYMDAYDEATKMLMYVVIGEGVFAVMALVIIELLVFLPTIKAFHHEKHVRLGLLSLISKRDVQAMIKKYRDFEAALVENADNDGIGGLESSMMDDKDKTKDKDKNSKHSRFRGDRAKQEKFLNETSFARDKVCHEFRPLYVKLFVALVVIAILFATQVLITANDLNSDIEVMERVTDTRLLENAVGSMFMSSYFFIEELESMVRISIDWDDVFEEKLDDFLRYYNGLLYGNRSMDLGDITPFMSPARKRLYDTEILPQSSVLVQSFSDLMACNHTSNTFMNPDFGRMQVVWDQPGTLKLPLRADSNLYNQRLQQTQVDILTLNDWWLPFLLVVMIGYLAIVYRGVVHVLEEDVLNTTKLLWTLPIDTIRSVEPIKYFLVDPAEYMSRLDSMRENIDALDDQTAIKVSDYAERVMESNRIACVVLNNDSSKIAYANGVTAELFKYEKSSLRGLKYQELVPPVHRVSLDAAVKETLSSSGNHDHAKVELRITAMEKDGTTFPVHISIHRVVIQRGKLRNRSAVCIEFSKIASTGSMSALEDPTPGMHRELWNLIWTHTPALLIDMNGTIEAINQSGATLLGVKVNDLASKSLRSLIDFGRNTNESAWRSILDATGAEASDVTKIRINLKGKDQSIPVRLMLRPVGTGNSSDYRKAVCVIEDLTESSRVEQRAVRIQHERNAVLSTLASAVIGLDEDGTIAFLSDEAMKVLRIERGSVVGQSIASIHCGGASFDKFTSDRGRHSVVLVRGDSTELSVDAQTVEYKSLQRKTYVMYLSPPQSPSALFIDGAASASPAAGAGDEAIEL